MHVLQKLMCASLLVGSGLAVADTELPVGTRCRMEFAQVDDDADKDMQEANRTIALLESEIADPGVFPSRDALAERLVAAKLRRNQVLEKHHDDVNAIRDRCDKLRLEERTPISKGPPVT